MALVEHFYRHLVDGQDEGSAFQQGKLGLNKEFGSEAVPFYRVGFNLASDTSAEVLPPSR